MALRILLGCSPEFCMSEFQDALGWIEDGQGPRMVLRINLGFLYEFSVNFFKDALGWFKDGVGCSQGSFQGFSWMQRE